MHANVQKWGNSLALRIPKAFAVDAKLENHSLVEISISDGQIIVKPVVKSDWPLKDLLAGVNKENIHSEVEIVPLDRKNV